MKFVFVDKTEKECDIITDILTSYGVKYVLTHNKIFNPFCGNSKYIYNITVDIEPEFYDYLCKEIDQKLESFTILENSYNLPSYDKNEKPKSKTKTKNNEEHKQPTSVFDMITSCMRDMLGNDVEDEYETEQMVVPFCDLPDHLKEDILRQIPFEKVKFAKCVIRQHENGISVSICI